MGPLNGQSPPTGAQCADHERVALAARVHALEEALYDACCEKVYGHTTTTIIKRALKLGVPGVRALVAGE
jgi:hypothetical protein